MGQPDHVHRPKRANKNPAVLPSLSRYQRSTGFAQLTDSALRWRNWPPPSEQTVRDFADTCVRPLQAAMIETGRPPRDLWIEAGRRGLLGLAVPLAYGGGEAKDWKFSAILMEELAAVSAAIPSFLSIHFDVVAPYLVELTTEEQRERWLPRFCTGDLVTTIAMTEPSGGSDLARIRTNAVRDGTDWILSGSKTFITNGGSADLLVVAARTNRASGSKGITLFGVEAGMPGFSRGRNLDKVGQREADTAEVFFDEVRVPQQNVIGQVDRGFQHMMRMLPQERLGAAVTSLAHARPILQLTLAYARERQAFGTPIGSMQHNKFHLAEMATKLDVAQSFVDACIDVHCAGALSPVAAAKAKWWCADVQNQIIDRCVQLHGGYGYMNEYRVARAWTDARVSKIWAGSNEIMKEIVSRSSGM